MSSTEPDAPPQGWWARQSGAVRGVIVGGVVVAVGVLSFGIASSVSSSSSSSSPAALASAESKTTDLGDLGDYCDSTEISWLTYVIGNQSSLYITPALLASAPGREAAMAAYLDKHGYPSSLARDVDAAMGIYSRNYLHSFQVTPKPAAGDSVAKDRYLTLMAIHAYNPAASALSSSCSAYSVDQERQIVAIPEPGAKAGQNNFSLP